MEKEVLKQEVLDRVKQDPLLYGKVAAAIGVAPSSMPRLIYTNSDKFTQIGVLRIISEHLNIDTDNLLEIKGEVKLAL